MTGRLSSLILLCCAMCFAVEEVSLADEVMPSHRRTGLLLDERYRNHDTGPDHPERPERLDVIATGLRALDTYEQLVSIVPRLGADRWILKAHSSKYLETVKRAHEKGMNHLPTGDTPFSPKSLETARLAVGGVLEACDKVIAKEIDNAFCVVRPPGHHATRDEGMGFCVFGNVAVAAKYLQEKHGLERILVVDWDVHHGNGTYDILKDDPEVFQFHLQQQGIYPGTGMVSEIGEAAAKGNTINVPLPEGAGRDAFVQAFNEQLAPAMEKFRPQFILISAGFDAHEKDLLGGLSLRSEDYGELTRLLTDIAHKYCAGRIVSALEGGYHTEALSESARYHVKALQGVMTRIKK